MSYWTRWYRAHRDHMLAWQRDYRKKNRDALNAAMRRWRRENSERLQAEPSRNSLYRKLRRCGVDRHEAARMAGIVLSR